MTAAESIPDELPSIAGGWAIRSLSIAGTTFEMMLPAQPDALLDAVADRAPYWSYLWPTAYDLAAWILEFKQPNHGDVLEIGSGTGLAGLAGLAAGWGVTFSDYEPAAVRLAIENARRNGFAGQRGIVLDWRDPPRGKYASIVGCDVLYDVANHGVILDLLEAMLTEDGVCLLADPHRGNADEFAILAEGRGFAVTQEQLPIVPFPDRPKVGSRLFRLSTHPHS